VVEVAVLTEAQEMVVLELEHKEGTLVVAVGNTVTVLNTVVRFKTC